MAPGYLVTIGAAVPNIGNPIMPTGQEIIDGHVITHRDAEHMDVIVPVHLEGTDQIWTLCLLLDAGPSEPDGEPLWLWGLGEQRLLTSDELHALATS